MKGKTAVVTGGSNGIGRALTLALLERGANVAVIDKYAPPASISKSENLLFMQGDIAEKHSVEAFSAAVISRFKSVDSIINNACFSNGGIISGCTWERFSEILSTGVTAPYYLTLQLMQHLAPGAAIVNISSSRAYMSQPDTESYTAAKGGISALTHALAVSLRGLARVNSISPGWIDTGAFQQAEGYTPRYSQADILQHPVERVGRPDDIVEAALFLLSDKAGFITGQNLTIDGGMSTQMIYSADCGWEYHPNERREY